MVCEYDGAGGLPVENEGSDMNGFGGGSSVTSFFFLWRRSKMAPRTIRAIPAIPPMTPPTMPPTGVVGAAVASGGAEEVADPATAVLVADVVEDSALEEAPEDVDDDCEVELEEDDLLDVVEEDLVLVLVLVEVTLTVDRVLPVCRR